MKLFELIKDLVPQGGLEDQNIDINGISYDSRRTQPGDLFVAVRGFETDGHLFIPQALERGAAAVLCERPSDTMSVDVPCFAVSNSRVALAEVSRLFYRDPAKEMRIIGITGTSGKTSVSTLLAEVIEHCLPARIGLIGTNGIRIGQDLLPASHTTPESLEMQKLLREMADCGCTHVVMEVSSHALSLHRTDGILFDTAVYTNLSQDHLDFHGDMLSYAAAKRMLFQQCRRACLNADDAWYAFMAEKMACPQLSFGMSQEADLRAEHRKFLPDRVRFNVCFEEQCIPAELHIPGSFAVENALAVLAAAVSEGIDLEAAVAALRECHGVRGRLEQLPSGGAWQIFIDYSHKPDALEKVLRSLRPVTEGRLICLFGCGGDRDRGKRPMMGGIAARLSDFVILTSDNPRTENPEMILDEIEQGLQEYSTPYIRITDRVEAIHCAIDLAQPGDTILLAGKGHETYQIVGHEKHPMDERVIVAEYLKQEKSP